MHQLGLSSHYRDIMEEAEGDSLQGERDLECDVFSPGFVVNAGTVTVMFSLQSTSEQVEPLRFFW